MRAIDARKLSESAAKQQGTSVKAWIEAIENKIRAAANAGKRSIVDPFAGVRMPAPSSSEAVDEVRRHFKAAGFEWIDHPPAHDAYTEIKW